MGGIIYTPNYKAPQPPDANAGDYPLGSIWESDDGSRWMNYWDSDERRFIWSYINPWDDLKPLPTTWTYTFEEEL